MRNGPGTIRGQADGAGGRATRTVLTTGANSGIGLATVVEVARRGFRSVGSVRTPDKARLVEEAARRADVTVETVLLDVRDAAQCTAVVRQLQPWGLVNNAGLPAAGAIEDIDDDEARAVLDTMVLAPVRLARLALPGMRAAGEGRIVQVSSIFGRAATPLTGWYQGAKHALDGLTEALRLEVAAAGVRVSVVEPGCFRTALWADALRDLARREPSHHRHSYARASRGMRAVDRLMSDPGRVATVIGRALVAPRPRARYVVGWDARPLLLLEGALPRSLRDPVKRWLFGL
jgi:NAD(P)-dependent dehydrogenase (short-subunit alcohol dehydrogenase family)